MDETATRSIGLAVVAAFAVLIGWLYARQPQTLAQVTGGLSAAVGVYTIDDPASRDARTQFYIAYTFYRQGWGRMYHDNALYADGLAAIDRAIALAPAGRLVVDDPALGMHTPEELKAELAAGLRVDASDFNPARLFKTRK
jgi:hypothetical protein